MHCFLVLRMGDDELNHVSYVCIILHPALQARRDVFGMRRSSERLHILSLLERTPYTFGSLGKASIPAQSRLPKFVFGFHEKPILANVCLVAHVTGFA